MPMKALSRSALGALLFIGVWYAAAAGLDKSMILPGPAVVFRALLQLLAQADTWNAIYYTAVKVLLTLVLVLLTGVATGIWLGRAPVAEQMSRPLILVIQAVPVISWLSLVIFSWGISWQGPVFIAFLSLWPTAVLTTLSGMRALDRDLLEMARLYRVSRYKVMRDIYRGALLPFFLAATRVCLGQAWKVILVAEFLVGDKGLGVQIAWARQLFDVNGIYACTLCAVLLGLLSEGLAQYGLKRMAGRWTQV
jgi:NitT/TauT family transport system permease protein